MAFTQEMIRTLAGRVLGPGLVVLLLVIAAGCETTSITSLEANSAAYADARSFLRLGVTTSDQVFAKYDKPHSVEDTGDGGFLWRYSRTEEVVVNAYTRTPVGTEGAMMGRGGGFQHTIPRTTRMDLFFGANGVLRDYRVYRDARP